MLSLAYFQVYLGDIATFNQSYEWEDIRPGKGEAPRERSRDENKKGKKGNKDNGGFTKIVIVAGLLCRPHPQRGQMEQTCE